MLSIKNHYFEQNELLMCTLEGEITPNDLKTRSLGDQQLPEDCPCQREVVDCRRLEVSDAVTAEALVGFAEKILTLRTCEMVLLIPADSPLHEGMAEALATVLVKKRRRIWLHYTLDEAINLLNLIQHNSPEPAIRYLRTAV